MYISPNFSMPDFPADLPVPMVGTRDIGLLAAELLLDATSRGVVELGAGLRYAEIARMLDLLGYAVDLAADGHEAAAAATAAIEAAAQGTPDATRYACILMDCQMPGLDGFEATRAIRAREAPGERVPIVAVTANAMACDRARCLEVGMDDFLAKPVELEVLRATLAIRARR